MKTKCFELLIRNLLYQFLVSNNVIGGKSDSLAKRVLIRSASVTWVMVCRKVLITLSHSANQFPSKIQFFSRQGMDRMGQAEFVQDINKVLMQQY